VHPSSSRALQHIATEEVVRIKLRGSCMAPHLAEGEMISVRRRRRYWPGDVIVFRTPSGDLAAHRLLGWRPAGLVTRGDHCSIHDAPVRRDAIVGAVQTDVPLRMRFRSLVQFARIIVRRLVA